MSSLPAMFQQAALPAHLANMSREQALAANAEAAAGAGGNSVNRISIKGSRFRVIIGGEEVSVLKSTELDVVVLRANPAVSHTFYLKKWNLDEEAGPPDCYSNDGKVPHSSSNTPQCATCDACPHHEWGSATNPNTGAKTRACADSKRIAIVPADKIADSDAFQLTIPAASLKEWTNYTRMLSSVAQPVPYFAVVTRLSFDTNESYPKLQFTPVRYLTAEEFAIAEERYDEVETHDAAALDNGTGSPVVVQKPVLAIAGVNPVAQAAPVAPAAPVAQAAPASGGWGGAAAAQQEEPAPAPRQRRTRAAVQQAPQEEAPVTNVSAPQPATIDGNTGSVIPNQSVPIGGDADLESVFGAGWQ